MSELKTEQKQESKGFIETLYKGKGVSDDYSKTLANLTEQKVKLKTKAAVGDVVLLVTKKGFENTAAHVGTVTEVHEESYKFDVLLRGEKQSMTLPYNFLAKKGMVTVGFYTVK